MMTVKPHEHNIERNTHDIETSDSMLTFNKDYQLEIIKIVFYYKLKPICTEQEEWCRLYCVKKIYYSC